MNIDERLEEQCKKIDALDYAIRALEAIKALNKGVFTSRLKEAKITSFTDSNGTIWRIDKNDNIHRTSSESAMRQELARRQK